MKILFVIPKIKSMFGGKGVTAFPHIGVAYLSAFLKQNNVQVAVFDEGLEENTQGLPGFINDFNPTLIGVTIFSYCYGFAYDLIKKIEEMTFAPIVVGGPHICAVGKNIFTDTRIDFAVKQEGEFTLLELLQELEKEDHNFFGIKGLIWRKGNEITENSDQALIQDLDELPFPDYESFSIERYACYKQKLLPLITSRGCPFSCNYCSVNLSMGRRFRGRSAKNVFSEIKYFYDKGINSFDINDDCFTLDQRRAHDICDLIISSRLNIRFQLYNGIRVDTVSSSLLKKMKAAGCYFISFGCEAGNNRILAAIKKGITLEQVKDAVNWANEAGIPNSVNFIIGHKDETYEDAQDTIRFAKSLDTNFVNFYNLVPYPGTESFEWVKQHARFLVPQDSFLQNISYRDNQPVFETGKFSRKQRQKIMSMGFDLYKRKILTFRLGKELGRLVYWCTKPKIIDRLATEFTSGSAIGGFIYKLFSKKSFLLCSKK